MRHPNRMPALLTAGAPWVLALLLVALVRVGLAVTPPAGGGSGIEFSAITLSYNPDGTDPVDGPILRGKEFHVRVMVRDNDPVGDPPPNYDVITQVRLYCRKKTDGAWPDWMRGQRNFDEPWHKAEFKVGEDLDLDGPDANGWYMAVIAQTINAAGLYQFAVEADDAGNPTNDDTGKAGDKDATVLGVDYVIVVPNPAYVVVSGQVVLTGKAYSFGLKANGDADDQPHFDNSGNPIEGTADNDVQMAGPFDWTRDPELGSLYPPQGDATTFTASAEPETVTVTGTHHETGVAGNAAVHGVKITQGADLWWFNFEDAIAYQEMIELTADGAQVGTFLWEVTQGQDIVNLNNGGVDADTITAVNDNTVMVRSINASAAPDDVAVRLKINGAVVFTHKLTVYSPASAVLVEGYPFDDSYNNGFESVYLMTVKDQFDNVIPYELEVNEDFGVWGPDYLGENWDEPDPDGTITRGRQFPDGYVVDGELVPMPVHPWHPEADVKVQNAPQWYYAGSTTPGRGKMIKSHTCQYYRGKGRQE